MSDLTNNFFLHNSRGKLAGAVLGVRKSRTIMRENVKPSNPQTYAQMERRVKWGNLVNVYRILKSAGVSANSFEDKSNRLSEYNALMSANPCDENNLNWLEKEQAKAGFISAKSPIVVAHGSLGETSATYSTSEKAFVTNIVVDEESGEAETFGEWWANVLKNNTNIIEGDELTFVIITQKINDGKPTQEVKVESHTVDTTDTTAIDENTLLGTNDAELTFDGTFQTIGSQTTEFGFVIHSRKTESGVKVSTARMTQGGYALPNTLAEAIESYAGEAQTAFLDPTN